LSDYCFIGKILITAEVLADRFDCEIGISESIK